MNKLREEIIKDPGYYTVLFWEVLYQYADENFTFPEIEEIIKLIEDREYGDAISYLKDWRDELVDIKERRKEKTGRRAEALIKLLNDKL